MGEVAAALSVSPVSSVGVAAALGRLDEELVDEPRLAGGGFVVAELEADGRARVEAT